MTELKTGFLRVTQVHSRQMVERYLDGPDNHRERIHHTLHRLMQQTLYERLSDGRDYVVRVGKPHQQHPDLEPDKRIFTYELDALVLMLEPAEAKVGEYLHESAFIASPDASWIHTFSVVLPPKIITMQVRSLRIVWDSIGEWIWEVVSKTS